MLSHVWLFVTPRTVARQGPLFMGLLEQVAISSSRMIWVESTQMIYPNHSQIRDRIGVSYCPPYSKGDRSGCSLEGMMLKLKLQYFGHLMRKVNSLEKTLMLGGIGGRKRRGRQRMRWLDGSPTRWTWVWVNSGSWWWTGRPGVLRFMGLQRVGHDWATELTDCLLHCQACSLPVSHLGN